MSRTICDECDQGGLNLQTMIGTTRWEDEDGDVVDDVDSSADPMEHPELDKIASYECPECYNHEEYLIA